MNMLLRIVGVVGLLVQLVCDVGGSDLQRLSRAHLEFGLTLFKEVARESSSTDNILISPYSVASVMSQLWLGAGKGSRTFDQLQQGLHYKQGGLGHQKVHELFQSSLYTLQDSHLQSVVEQGNGLFVQAGVRINPTYESAIRLHYNATIDQVDFKNGEPIARSIINRWVNNQTDGQIPDLLETPLPQDTKILLVNALAMKAFWKNSFNPTMTAANGIFHYDSKTKLEIPMMAGKFQALLGESQDLHCRLLELPFRGKRLSMFILLPDEGSEVDGGGLFQLERNLTAQNLKKLLSTLRDEMVHIRMPRFKLAQSSPLADTLTRMGFTDIFDPSRADFTGISTEDQLSVTALAHKVTLEITEKGAKAAAATALGIERFGEIGEFFEINRPFLFFIWDYQSGALLFISRVVMPEPLLQ